MRNTTLLAVFSVLRNVETFVKGKKDVDIFKSRHMIQYKRSSKYHVDNARRFYNDIENGYYRLNELATYLLYQYLIGLNSFSLYKIKPKMIQETMKIFTFKKVKEDLVLLKEISKELGFKKGLCDFFKMKEDGTNIAYTLTVNERISPTFFIRNYENCLTLEKENDIFISNELKQFIRIANKIKSIL